MDHPGVGEVCPEGGAHSRSRGGRHNGPSFGGPRSNLRRPPGPLCSAHFVPRPAAGDAGECSGVRAAPADADHLLMLPGCRQPRYALRPFISTGCNPPPPPPPSVATFVATPRRMMTSPSFRHGLRLSAGCARMLMWRCEQSRSW